MQELQTIRRSIAALTIGVCLASPVLGQDEGRRGGEVGSFTNDFFGDGHDRWFTGSYQRSYFSAGSSSLYDSLEVRARSEIVSPWTPSRQPDGDRPYSTALGVGLFSHGQIAGLESRIGAEFLLIGEDTGLEELQRVAHDGLGLERAFDPSDPDHLKVESSTAATFEMELGRTLRFGNRVSMRPYIGLTAGGDQAAMIGTDFVFGSLAGADLWTRDVVTGRLLTPQTNDYLGFSWVFGFDARAVEQSVHLPDDAGVVIEPEQFRARGGIQANLGWTNVFLGQAWLSEGFEGQTERQRVGLLSVSFNF